MVYSAKSAAVGTISQFTRRKEIKITTAGTSTPASYQTKVTIAYEPGMQSSFQDIRFNTKIGNAYIDYWIESKVDSDTATVFLELPDAITDPGNDTVWMYYGNAGLSSASSISSVAQGGVHYTAETNVLPSAYTPAWTLDGAAGAVSSGLLTMTDASTSASSMYTLSDADIAGNVIITTRMRFVSGNPQAVIHISTTAHSWYIDLSATAITNSYRTADTAAVDSDTEAVYDFVLVGDTLTIYRNGVSVLVTINTHTSSNYMFFGCYGNTATGVMEFRNIFMRKYIANEPTSSIGTAQHQRRVSQFM